MQPLCLSLRRALCVTTAIAIGLPAAAQTVDNGTPPARVGQVAGLVGSVSFNGAGSNGAWVQAQANYPLTAGDTLYTQAGAEVAVALDSSRVTLAPSTELQVTSLDDQTFAATQAQGEIFLNLTALQPGQSFTINTQGGIVTMQTGGQYDVIAGPTTTVSVLSGQAIGANATVGAGQAANLANGQAQVLPLQEDDFMRHVLSELAPPPPPYVPPVVEQMTGVAALSSYGSWNQDADYGAVWYPQVGSDWTPYREGSWAYVAPWGWTWVEAEPWGFAPFHYGRWIHHEDRWGWVPAADRDEDAGYTPVYAPAVVTFFGLAAGAAITAAVLSGGHVGWVPLAPGEAYRPPYHASDSYIQRINRTDINRTTNINIRETTINNYANHGGATYAPAAAMARGERMNRAGGGVPPAVLANARPAEGMINSAIRPNMTQRPAEAPRPPAARPAAAEFHPGTMSAPGARPALNAPGSHGNGTAGPEGQRPDLSRPQAARPAADAPRPEAAKPTASQRPEAVRPETPRPEATRPQAPRPEAAKPEAPRPEAVRPEAVRPEAVRPEAPRMEAPRPEIPRPEAPRPEAPRPEAPRVEAPRAEAPRPEAPRPPPPRPEPARPEAPRPAPGNPHPS